MILDYIVIGLSIILILSIICYVIAGYYEIKIMEDQNKKLEENIKKFKTRTGALHNDRKHERTTIPKRNGKRNT